MGMIARNYRGLLPILGLLAAGALLAQFLQASFYINLLTLTILWAVLALSWNIISGYAGMISFGHAAFWGIGAYVVVILQTDYGITPWIGILVATFCGVMAGAFIGAISLRLSGIYFGLAMLCYPMALIYLLEYLGLQELTVPMIRENGAYYMQFEDQRGYTYVALGLLALGLLISFAIERSRMGLWLMAIKQNEAAASALGINCFAWKLVALMVSGGLAASAGALYAQVVLVLTPQSVFGLMVSAQAIIFTLFGGVGIFWGPVIGAAVLVPLAELLKHELGAVLPGIGGVVFGIAVVAIVLLAPNGIYWRFARKDDEGEAADPYSRAGKELVFANDKVAAPVHEIKSAAGDVPILSVQSLSCSFGGVRAVDDVSFDVQSGQILGVIGPNGAGKTTLLNLINGFIKPDGGVVRYRGESILEKKIHVIARLGVSRTFQVARVFPQMSLFGNVAVGSLIAQTGAGGDWSTRTRTAIEAVGLSERANKLAATATAFDLRLMELARAIAAKPDLLMVDECLAGLSGPEADHVVEALQKIRDSGITIIIIEHTMQAMLRLADRFIVLDHGSIISDDLPELVIKQPKVLEAYLGKKWAERQANA